MPQVRRPQGFSGKRLLESWGKRVPRALAEVLSHTLGEGWRQILSGFANYLTLQRLAWERME